MGRPLKNYKQPRAYKGKTKPEILKIISRIAQLQGALCRELKYTSNDLAHAAGEGSADNFRLFDNLSADTVNPDTFGRTPRLWHMLIQCDLFGVKPSKLLLIAEEHDDAAFMSFITFNKGDLVTAINEYRSYTPAELTNTCEVLRNEIKEFKEKLLGTDDFEEEEKLSKELKSRRASLKILLGKTK